MKKVPYLLSLNVVFVFLFVFTSLDLTGQLWYRYRHEMYVAAGASNLLGDLGGAEGSGSLGLRDFNAEATNIAVSAGHRYKLSESFTLRNTLSYIRVSGSDEFTGNEGRRSRNLSVRTTIVEFSPMIEFFLIQENIPKMTRFSSRKFRGAMRGAGPYIGLYVASGISAIYFNPQAELNGRWHSLRPLGTEGQGLRPGTSIYSEFSVALPVAIGLKVVLNRDWSIGIEAAARFAMTDYLDDVSTTYYDNAAIANAYGPIAAQLADRRLSDTRGLGRGVRGNPENKDVYLMLQTTVSKRFKSKSRKRPRYSSRPSF